jgi:hypothetical protein
VKDHDHQAWAEINRLRQENDALLEKLNRIQSSRFDGVIVACGFTTTIRAYPTAAQVYYGWSFATPGGVEQEGAAAPFAATGVVGVTANITGAVPPVNTGGLSARLQGRWVFF